MTVVDNSTDVPTLDQPQPIAVSKRGKSEDHAWLASGSIVTLSGSLVGRALNVGAQIVLARLLGPAEFGLYAIGWALLQVSSLFTPLGLDNGVIHCATSYATEDPKRLGAVVRESLILTLFFGSCIGVLTFAIAPELARHIFGKADLLLVVRLFAVGFPLAAGLKVAAASTTVSQSINYRVYAELLAQPAVNLALIVVFYIIGWRLLGATLATVLSFGGALVLAMWYQEKLFPHVWFHGPIVSKAVASELLRFSAAAWLGAAFVNLIPWVDRLFLGAYADSASVGIYQAAAQASVLFGVVAGALNAVVAPRIAFLYRGSQIDRLEHVYKIVSKWVLFANVPFFLLFFAAPQQVLAVLYGGKYANGAGPLIILSFTRLADALVGPIGTLMIFTARQKVFAVIAGGGLALSIVLNHLLIPRFGPMGAASATACSEAAMLVALLLVVWSTTGFWPYDRRWLKGLFAATVAAGVIFVARPMEVRPPWIGLLTTLALGTTVFACGLVLLGLDEEDREMIRTLKLYLLRYVRAS